MAAILNEHAIDAIDIAPGKYFPNLAEASEEEILQTKAWWADRGIEITGMQALLFGTSGLNVFGTRDAQEAMLAHLGAICRIGGVLRATRLVFGSPKNRDRTGLDDRDALEVATAFFRRLGDKAEEEGVIVCLEPNPPCYGANFMTTSEETAEVVEAIDHPAIRMQLDTGAMAMNQEEPFSILERYASLIGHIHASEPNLVPLGDGNTDHQKVFEALKRIFNDSLVCIEMVATKNESHLDSIRRAIQTCVRFYRPSYF